MLDNEFLFTSESVTEGHPDKIADQISDGVLDAVLRDDPTAASPARRSSTPGWSSSPARSRPAPTSTSRRSLARRSGAIGYTDAAFGFDYKTCAVLNTIDKQSPDIAQGVDEAYEMRGRSRATSSTWPAPATRG